MSEHKPYQITAQCTCIQMEFVADDYGHIYPSGTYIFTFNDNPELTVRDDEPDAYAIGEKYNAIAQRWESTTSRTALVSVGEEATNE